MISPKASEGPVTQGRPSRAERVRGNDYSSNVMRFEIVQCALGGVTVEGSGVLCFVEDKGEGR